MSKTLPTRNLKKKKMIDTHLILDATINGTSSERFDK